MIHFRNTIICQYRKMDAEIVKSVPDSGLDDLIELKDHITAFPTPALKQFCGFEKNHIFQQFIIDSGFLFQLFFIISCIIISKDSNRFRG